MPSRQAAAPCEPPADFLVDWRTHLRAEEPIARPPSSRTSQSAAFCEYLSVADRGSGHTSITRHTVESYLAELNDSLSS